MLVRKVGETTWRSPKITAYADERAIQTIIEQSPGLLPDVPGDRMAVASELAIEAGYIDITAVDASGSITLVECKLRANPEIRRHVVGQVIAYAAALWGLSYEAFDQAFSARTGISVAKMVSEFAPDDWDEETFRANVATNLHAGRFRLVIAVDQITEELGRIVQYLNGHTSPELQVVALELRYVADEGLEIIVPSIYGTESAQSKVAASTGRSWDETKFFASLAAGCSPPAVEAARQLYDFAKTHGATFRWSRGPFPSVTARLPVAGKPASVFSLYEWPEGNRAFAVNIEYLTAYVDHVVLTTLAERLRAIPGVPERFQGLEQAGFRGRPSLPLDQIVSQPGAVEQICQALEALLALES